ncbi:MAG: alanine--tRNA ligase [Kiritimatiellae bacterium]|nr:alanine--tRNA ligase [Kiritimatiellia bacterium]
MKEQPTARQVRASFLDFFRSKGHEIVPSSPLVIPADPTLLFANAGMNQFKEIFLGARQSGFKRVANTQKCIRVSGKHNDLEEVGLDTYHHTFFEMLGNWSFGDYYKREAITWAWELLTGVWGLPKDRLWVTVFREDDEAEGLWKELTDVRPDHILRFDEKDNFWEMAETGPCGPCSEIHIDLTAKGCQPEDVNSGSPEVIELWNLVFIQYNRRGDGKLEELPAKHVDTGAGFERIVAVLQGKRSNYDTDLFMPLIRRVEELSGHTYEGEAAVAMRVIADHLRTLSFAIADGVVPSNEGRGYVLRRLLRRAARYGRKIGLKDPFMGGLFPILEGMMGAAFKELKERRKEILRALQAEEESFADTVDRGIAMFDEVVAGLKARKETTFPGEEAFKLYDTYGFPVDLTTLMAAEQDLNVDKERFDELMEQQRARARNARKDAALQEDIQQAMQLAAQGIRCVFTGYETTEDETQVVALISSGKLCDELAEGAEGELVLAKTPFYAESGGQVGDEGVIRGPAGEFEVWDTQRPAEGIVLHIGKVVQGRLARGEAVAAQVDKERRARIQRHHTATHLLNFALRELVSPGIRQAGSFVAPDRLRFDFNHYEAVSVARLEEIERLVNERVMQNEVVKTYDMALKDVHGTGIIAVFDEKYGDVVRVLDVGGYSRELCGGTHVKQTGDIGLFRIVSESSVASGVRRIEAVCGVPALEMTRREHEMVRSLAQRLSVPAVELQERVEALVEQNRKLAKDLKQKASRSATDQAGAVVEKKQDVKGVTLVAAALGEYSMDELRAAMDAVRAKVPSGVIVLGSTSAGKACFVALVTDDLVKRGVHAGKLVGEIARVAGGGGGGQPHKAQAGGKDAGKLKDAIAGAADVLASML